MINLIFTILKILGLLFLIFIILILFILIILLISNVNLALKIKYTEKFYIDTEITYLFKTIKYIYNNEKDINQFKIFGIDLLKVRNNKNSKNNLNNKEFLNNEENTNENYIQNYKNHCHTTLKETKKLKNLRIKKNKTKKTNKKVKTNITLIEVKQIIRLTICLLKRLAKMIKIKNLESYIEYGFEDPFLTGAIFGIINIFLPVMPHNLKIIPNFEKEIKKINLHLIGKLNLFKFVICIIIFICKKPIRKIIFYKGEIR